MAIKRNALGRGLDSLISMDDVQPSGSSAINEIAIDLIKPNPDQPRINFDEEALEELATSIRELGIIQPLTLRSAEAGTYMIISGERRYRAAKLAGLDTVPAYVRTANDSELTEMALIENIQREDLNAIEEAQGISRLTESVYETRFFGYCTELESMGANIKINGKTATVSGVPKLQGATVYAHDLRAGAALVIAGLAAEGTTNVEHIHFVERGYESLVEKLTALGADIRRVDDDE